MGDAMHARERQLLRIASDQHDAISRPLNQGEKVMSLRQIGEFLNTQLSVIDQYDNALTEIERKERVIHRLRCEKRDAIDELERLQRVMAARQQPDHRQADDTDETIAARPDHRNATSSSSSTQPTQRSDARPTQTRQPDQSDDESTTFVFLPPARKANA